MKRSLATREGQQGQGQPPERAPKPTRATQGPDPSTPSLAQLVDCPREFMAGFHTDGSIFAIDAFGAKSEQYPRLRYQLGQSNPSLLLACQHHIGTTRIANVTLHGGSGTGEYHDGHLEHRVHVTDSPLSRPFLDVCLADTKELSFAKYGVAVLGEKFLKKKDNCLRRGLGWEAARVALKPITDKLTALNATGHAASVLRSSVIPWDRTPTLGYIAGMFSANGTCSAMVDKKRNCCKLQLTIRLSRDAAGLAGYLLDFLGFGAPERHKGFKTDGVCDGDITALGFWCPYDQDKLFALLSGAQVVLAGGTVVPATASGLPRAVGKLLKFKTMREYYARHKKPAPQAGKYTMAALVPGTDRRGWWCDGKQWRRMHAELHPGVPVPDYEH